MGNNLVVDSFLGKILVNQDNAGYCSNTVSNTKYKWWSFIFVNVFEQLMYFLDIG